MESDWEAAARILGLLPHQQLLLRYRVPNHRSGNNSSLLHPPPPRQRGSRAASSEELLEWVPTLFGTTSSIRLLLQAVLTSEVASLQATVPQLARRFSPRVALVEPARRFGVQAEAYRAMQDWGQLAIYQRQERASGNCSVGGYRVFNTSRGLCLGEHCDTRHGKMDQLTPPIRLTESNGGWVQYGFSNGIWKLPLNQSGCGNGASFPSAGNSLVQT